ncbi:MAG TPA: LppP/LprE family lipoprotein [Solirubrobacteraceae bacterium]
MDASARRVHAERSRRRLPPRLRSRRIGARLVGLIGTAGVAAVALAIALMVMPTHHGSGEAALAPAPTPTPQAKAKPHKPAGPTKAQLKERRAAVAVLSAQGYEPVRLSDYDFKTRFHALIGRRADGARQGFFFVLTHYIGHDALTPSADVKVVGHRRRGVTLAYRTYGPSDQACCPSGPRTTVRFDWDGTQLVTTGVVPPSSERLHTG